MSLLASSPKKFKRADLFFSRFSVGDALYAAGVECDRRPTMPIWTSSLKDSSGVEGKMPLQRGASRRERQPVRMPPIFASRNQAA
jgi:hypothetical protein